MQRVNLLYVITKLELGGAQKQALSIIKNIDREKFNIFLFTSSRGLLLSEASSIKGVKIKCSKFLESPINPFCDILSFFEIFLFIRKNRIIIVHTHSSKAGIIGRWAARCAKVNIILHTVHGWSFNAYQRDIQRKIFVWLEKITARITSQIIIVSSCDRQKGIDNAIGAADKYRIIRYGIDYSEFKNYNGIMRNEFGIGLSDPVVGMIACFKPQKAPLDFIELAWRLTNINPQAKFLLIGDGVLRKKIIKLIERNGLKQNVILTGWRRNIPELISSLDVFVLTSLWEGLPVSVLEAMAAAKAVVVTRTGGIEEVIREGENGFLVNPRQVSLMAERVQVLLKDKNLRNRIGQNARMSLKEDFLTGSMVKNYQLLYEDLALNKTTFA